MTEALRIVDEEIARHQQSLDSRTEQLGDRPYVRDYPLGAVDALTMLRDKLAAIEPALREATRAVVCEEITDRIIEKAVEHVIAPAPTSAEVRERAVAIVRDTLLDHNAPTIERDIVGALSAAGITLGTAVRRVERPTEPGFYWARWFDDGDVTLVEYDPETGHYYSIGHAGAHTADHFTDGFVGPLVPPEPPDPDPTRVLFARESTPGTAPKPSASVRPLIDRNPRWSMSFEFEPPRKLTADERARMEAAVTRVVTEFLRGLAETREG